MKKRNFIVGSSILFIISACTPPEKMFTGTVTSVTLSSNAVNVRENGNIVLQAQVLGSGDFNPALNWKIEAGGKGTLSSDKGNSVTYTAPSSTSGQVVRVAVSSLQDPMQKKTLYLGVQPNQSRISAGQYHSLAVKSDGTVLAWGSDQFGRLGDDSTIAEKATPVAVANASTVVAVSAGEFHSLALKSNGTMLAWGGDDDGQLGDDSLSTASKPTPVPVSGATGIVAISASFYHSLALKSDGTVLAWGDDAYGQLGDNSTLADKKEPSDVQGLTDIVAISAGAYHSLALKSDGTVLAWGWDIFGQLGDNTTLQDQPTPVVVANLSQIVAISAGGYHNLAVKSDGTVLAWGSNQYGQLGDDTNSNKSTPIVVPGVAGIVAVSGNEYHSLALKSDGTMLAWGLNGFGQLGDGTQVSQKIPVAVSGATGIEAISAGEFHSLCLKSDGKMLAWGRDADFQLGDNAASLEKFTPTAVALGASLIRLP